jgi:hypothetical protein
MNIVTFAKNVLNMELFDYEISKLVNFEEYLQSTEFMEYVRPRRRENQRTYHIWLSYQEYISKPVAMISVPEYV